MIRDAQFNRGWRGGLAGPRELVEVAYLNENPVNEMIREERSKKRLPWRSRGYPEFRSPIRPVFRQAKVLQGSESDVAPSQICNLRATL